MTAAPHTATPGHHPYSPGSAAGGVNPADPGAPSLPGQEAIHTAGQTAPAGELREEAPAGANPLVITVYGQPKSKGSMRHIGRGRMVEQVEGSKDWRVAVKEAARAEMPLLDDYFPRLGQCGVCGVPGVDQRHRIIDAIREQLLAGEEFEVLAEEFGVTADAVRSTLYPLTEPVCVEATITVTKPKSAPKTRETWPITRSSGDVDKHARNLLDALVDAGVMRDDSQVIEAVVRKRYPGQHPDTLTSPGAVIRVWTHNPANTAGGPA